MGSAVVGVGFLSSRQRERVGHFSDASWVARVLYTLVKIILVLLTANRITRNHILQVDCIETMQDECSHIIRFGISPLIGLHLIPNELLETSTEPVHTIAEALSACGVFHSKDGGATVLSAVDSRAIHTDNQRQEQDKYEGRIHSNSLFAYICLFGLEVKHTL